MSRYWLIVLKNSGTLYVVRGSRPGYFTEVYNLHSDKWDGAHKEYPLPTPDSVFHVSIPCTELARLLLDIKGLETL